MTGELRAHTWYMLGARRGTSSASRSGSRCCSIQPMFWLLLYSQLFQPDRRPARGFETDSYVDFLAPGIVIMTAFFSGTWSGMAMITDLDRGVLERFLATPGAP